LDVSGVEVRLTRGALALRLQLWILAIAPLV
jgi:hypothetical protein